MGKLSVYELDFGGAQDYVVAHNEQEAKEVLSAESGLSIDEIGRKTKVKRFDARRSLENEYGERTRISKYLSECPTPHYVGCSKYPYY